TIRGFSAFLKFGDSMLISLEVNLAIAFRNKYTVPRIASPELPRIAPNCPIQGGCFGVDRKEKHD
ncbi:MAG: hypothetical protein OEU50_23720, partial [Gammaproteobacteria bacterium]|nr:hypothetical protein [Gammaproteobacteria bacterium]